MTEREALKLALEALEKSHTCPLLPDDCAEAITAIKEALAQPEQLMSDQINYGVSVTQGGKRIDPMSIYKEPEQEPVTWRYKIVDVFGRPAWTLKTPKSDTRVLESQPLYTTPPQRPSRSDIKPLTDEEIILIVAECASSHQHTDIHFARAIERAHGIKELKEYKK